jgi:glycosyltransferase involved in cell wall biosynthesis
VRVLHVIPSVSREYGGPTASLLGYSLAAREGGATVTVAAASAAGESDEWFVDRAEVGGVGVKTFAGEGRGAFVRSAALSRWLKANVRSFDLVHVHGLLNPVSTAAAGVCRREGAPFAIRPFGMLSRYTFTHRRGWAKRIVFRLLDAPNLRAARALHFTTATEREQAAWHGLELRHRAFIVPPPVLIGDVARSEEAARGAEPMVLFLSRLNPVKSVETLLAAWPRVVRDRPDARLVIAGKGDPEYEGRLRALAPRDGVEFVGFADEETKRRLFARATVFVLPSHHENFGVAVVEALGAGLPVVITPEVQIASVVEEHGLGVVAERSPAAIATALSRVLSDVALQRHCGEAGPRVVRELFSLSTVSAQLMSMYRTMLTSSTAPRA